MKELAIDMLQGAVRLALELLGREHTIDILQAEYDAADRIADAAEEAKLVAK